MKTDIKNLLACVAVGTACLLHIIGLLVKIDPALFGQVCSGADNFAMLVLGYYFGSSHRRDVPVEKLP